MQILLHMQNYNELSRNILCIYALCELYLYNSQLMSGPGPFTERS